jgi:hypothetical protein
MYDDFSSSESPRAPVVAALKALHEVFGQDLSFVGESKLSEIDTKVSVLAEGLGVALTTLAASVGECRMSTPYAPIQLIRHADGTREWCCSHSPPDCDPV